MWPRHSAAPPRAGPYPAVRRAPPVGGSSEHVRLPQPPPQRGGHRSTAAVAQGPILLDLVANKKLTFDKAFLGGGKFGGGLFPPSQVGAVAAARGVEGELDAPGTGGARRKARVEQRRRQVEFAVRYVQLLMQAERFDFQDREAMTQFIRTRLKDALTRNLAAFYSVPAGVPATAGRA